MRFLVGLCVSVTLASPSLAQTDGLDPFGPPDTTQEAPLEGEALSALFQDQTHRGYYEYTDIETRDPAFTEHMGADGSAVHIQDGVTSVGEWRTFSNVVCFQYDTLNGGCFNMYQRGNCYYAMAAGTNQLVAVTVLDGDTPDCEPSYA